MKRVRYVGLWVERLLASHFCVTDNKTIVDVGESLLYDLHVYQNS